MRVRPALHNDADFIVGLADRLVEFGSVPGREPSQMVARDRTVLIAALEHSPPESVVYVAEDSEGKPLGFIHLTTDDDYYSARRTGHIGDVVVASEAGGQGVGTALIAFAEEWARERGFALLTLNVFTANVRARELYRKLGFQEEWIRCIKRLQS